MKVSKDETAERFDEKSIEYDETRDERHITTVNSVVEIALDFADEDTRVVDVGTGTGMVALRLAPYVDEVVGLDISEGMLEKAREKAKENGIENVEFRQGSFRNHEESEGMGGFDLVVSNFAMHHLSDDEKEDAVETLSRLLGDEGVVVIGDVIIFEELDNPEEYYSPDVDDPSTEGFLRSAFEDGGFDVDVEKLDKATGVVVAEI